MARFLDDVRRAGRLEMPWWVERRHHARWARHATMLYGYLQQRDLPVLLIDNVADYYYSGTSQEYWNLAKHFPNMAPPFPLFWTEHRFPKMIHSEIGDTPAPSEVANAHTGFLVFGALAENAKGENIPENAKWILVAEQFVDYGQSADPQIIGPHGSWTLAIDAAGQLIGNPWLQSWAGDEHAEMMQAHLSWLHPTLLAVSFMHCRNVSVADNPVPPKLARRYEERHGFAPTPYKTLVIEPLKAILRTEGKSGEHGAAHAMHICRGHFKDYREGKGLFGKYHQMVWHPSLVRGTKGRDSGAEVPAREIEVKL
jgi:hypothetical protein